MSTVYKEHYEITGKTALAKAQAFVKRRDDARAAHWKIVNQFGAEAYRPSYSGGVGTLFFKPDKKPDGFNKVGTENGLIECKPSRNTKVGKNAALALAEAPQIPSWRELADEFGWNGRSPIGEGPGSRTGFLIYHATGVMVSRPKIRFFLVFPRELNDKWKRPPGLKLVRESEMLRAIEDHNASKKRKKRK